MSAVYNITGSEEISGLAGMGKRAPYVAMVLAAALFSLAGLPVFAGFTSKFYLFNAAAAQGLLWLAGLAIFTSLISLYYYLMVVRRMYIDSEETTPIPSTPYHHRPAGRPAGRHGSRGGVPRAADGCHTAGQRGHPSVGRRSRDGALGRARLPIAGQRPNNRRQ